MSDHKLIMVSFDALVNEDLTDLSRLPTFEHVIENGARAEKIRSIYPTFTYPCHVTMASGCYPDKTGVISNYEFRPGDDDPPWNWYHSTVKCEDLLDVCHRAGYSTASVGWPASGGRENADYLVSEIWPHRMPSDEETFRRLYIESGTSEELYDEVVAPRIGMRLKRSQPDSSFFLIDIACDLIKKHRPDVMLIHVGNIDAYRHDTGVFSEKVERGVRECDEMLSRLISACTEAGTMEKTDLAVVSDHGHLDVSRIVNVNVRLRREGLIRVDENGEVASWDAWCASAGLSAYVILKDKKDTIIYNKVKALLDEMKDEGVWGFSEVRTPEETEALEHLDGDFSFMLETDGYSKFEDAWTGSYVKECPMTVRGPRLGYHGHHPDKGPCPVFIGCGPSFIPGARIPFAHLVDMAPTCARIMGVELPSCDGRAMTELLGGQI